MDAARLLEEPIYTPADAARLVRLTPSRVRRWLHGYRDASGPHTRRKHVEAPPVVRGRRDANRHEASFLDLIELFMVKALLDHGLSLQKLRRIVNELGRTQQIDHPFATKRFYLFGSKLFVQLDESLDTPILETLTGGQRGISQVITQCGTQIDFDRESKLARSWWPMGKSRRVVVTPERGFGAPTVANRSVKTSNVYDLFVGEHENVARVADWLDLSEDEVRDAVEFEQTLAAA